MRASCTLPLLSPSLPSSLFYSSPHFLFSLLNSSLLVSSFISFSLLSSSALTLSRLLSPHYFYNAALEFAERGLLTKIYPIMIGKSVLLTLLHIAPHPIFFLSFNPYLHSPYLFLIHFITGDKVTKVSDGGDPTVTYTNYFSSGCHPSSCPNVIVEAVEQKAKVHLERQV